MRYLVAPKENELQIDLDSDCSSKKLASLLYVLNKQIGYKKFSKYQSKTKGNYHIIVTLKRKLPALERILWQAILGSDPFREAHNYARVKNGKSKFPIFLAMKAPLKNNKQIKCRCYIPKNVPPVAARCECVKKIQHF